MIVAGLMLQQRLLLLQGPQPEEGVLAMVKQMHSKLWLLKQQRELISIYWMSCTQGLSLRNIVLQ
uniref:Uncharacterized protein MANES_09G037300 n=1 Tax=Rhizophora mucronata TaxID=61149 RepID=A0A2P2K2X1_RHIMU